MHAFAPGLIFRSGAGELMVRQVSSDTGCANHVNYGVDKGPDYHFPGRVSSRETPEHLLQFVRL